MLEFKNNPIPVEDSFSVRLEVVNPACYFDKIPGNAGVGITISVNEISRAIFGNPERFAKKTDASSRKFPGFSIRPRGMLMEAGTLVITNANVEVYQAWLQPEVGVMGEEQQDRFINELPWREGVDFSDKEQYTPGVDEYCKVKIRNEHFWEGKGEQNPVMQEYLDEDEHLRMRDEIKNQFSKDFDDNFQQVINETPLNNDTVARVISPFLFFQYFLRELLRANRFYIRSHPFNTIPGTSNLVLFNNYNIFDPEPRGLNSAVPPEEGGSYEEEFKTFDRRRNTYTTVVREVINETDWILKPFNFADLVPKASIKDALLSIQNFMNICFVFNPDRTVSIIDRESIPESEAFDLSAYMIGTWEKGEQKNVSLKFVVEYDKNDANFADEFHDLSDRWQDFKAPVNTYADLLYITAAGRRGQPGGDRTIGQLRYVRTENKIYEYKWTVINIEKANGAESQKNVLAWEFVSSGPQYFVYRNGDEIEEIHTGISTLQMENGELCARQEGNVNAMRNLWKDFSFRMFYYLAGDAGSVDYPGASCNWEGSNGIFEKRWKKWARFWANRQPVQAQFNLPMNVLHFVKNNITKKYRITEGEFIIESLQVDIGVDRIGRTTIKGFKI